MKPELLAPAGNWDAMVAAVQNGADAVYLGAGDFNARRGAGNFDADSLAGAVRYCHARSVRVHVTLNTLVFPNELDAFAQTVRQVYEAGADAAIVQDFGAARMIRSLAPEMEIHASTQMAVHNRQGVCFLAQNGFQRAVLAREMTFEEIAHCQGTGVALEAFVHGALCVACSGQCLFSSLVGGRSGNRGMCAQPCRLEYELLGKKGHLLSTKDLMGLENLDALTKSGVSSLKIEGRLKRPEYVAVTTRIYRKALDEGVSSLEDAVEELRQMFHRGGFTCGYGKNMAEADLMYPQRANNMGVQVGKCVRDGVIRLERDVLEQDSMALRRLNEDIPVKLQGEQGGQVSCREARRGDVLFRTVSEAQMRAARESYAGEAKTVEIDGRLRLRAGLPAELYLTDGTREIRVLGDMVQIAQKQPADANRLAAQVRKTGGTPYIWRKLELEIDGNAFLPASALNALRREGLRRLEDARCRLSRSAGSVPGVFAPGMAYPARPQIIAQASDAEALRKARAAGADAIVFAPMDVRADALEKAARTLEGETFFLAPPPVLPEAALKALQEWALCHKDAIDGVYATNIAHLGMAWPGELRGGFMLNCTNGQTWAFLREHGVVRYTPSLELTAAQIRGLPGERELVVYGRMPLMWLRHCPLRAAMNLPGTHRACRRCDACPADERLDAQSMRDRKRASFPLRRLATEEGCIALLQNCDTLMLLRKTGKLPDAFAWRLLLEGEDDVSGVVSAHVLAAQGNATQDAPVLQTGNVGRQTTTGHYFRGVE